MLGYAPIICILENILNCQLILPKRERYLMGWVVDERVISLESPCPRLPALTSLLKPLLLPMLVTPIVRLGAARQLEVGASASTFKSSVPSHARCPTGCGEGARETSVDRV
jgi:hypothetical protein